MNRRIYEKIDRYLKDTKKFIDEMNYKLEKKAHKKSNWYDAYNIVMYYRNQINYSIDGYEIYCRALRDKLNEQ